MVETFSQKIIIKDVPILRQQEKDELLMGHLLMKEKRT